MTALPQLALLADLADYPGPDFAARLAAALPPLAQASPVARGLVEEFGGRAAALEPARLEEIYAATFDLQPDCTLNLGHHLFGEDWKRSSLLIELAPAMRRAGLDPGGELPDHLCWLLRLVAGAPAGDADLLDLVPCVLVPGVRELHARLPQDHLYQPLLQALELVLAEAAA